jgi:hypothetical protein
MCECVSWPHELSDKGSARRARAAGRAHLDCAELNADGQAAEEAPQEGRIITASLFERMITFCCIWSKTMRPEVSRVPFRVHKQVFNNSTGDLTESKLGTAVLYLRERAAPQASA